MFTLDTGGGHAVAIPEKIVRRLTPLECERLQGFPDDWTLVGEKSVDSSRYKQMGNAVTVNVIAWIGSRL
jgi:DNA (cytosine-5)-methyltransferase 1